MKSFVFLLLSVFCLSFFSAASAQDTRVSGPVADTVGGGTDKLPPNQEIKDSKGRVIKNRGDNRNGGVKITFTGKIDKSVNPWVCSGEITVVTNPASQGSEGPIDINTNNEPTTINLDRNGTDPAGHVSTNIAGDNATVNVSGNFNDVAVAGNNSTSTITGNNNTETITGTNNNVTLGGRGNSVTSGGTTTRN